MAKRFIDTSLFSDEWFMELTKEGKLVWIYIITNCDHAGLFKVNKKLMEFQLGFKCYPTVTEQLGNRIVTVTEQLLFVPKFVKYQYPNFPHSKAKAQASAIKLLTAAGLFEPSTNSWLTVSQELGNSYNKGNDYGNGKSYGNGLENPEIKKVEKSTSLVDGFKDFDFGEFENHREVSLRLAKMIDESCPRVQKLEKPFTCYEICKIVSKHDPSAIKQIITSMENWKDLHKKHTSAYLTFTTWAKNDEKRKEIA